MPLTVAQGFDGLLRKIPASDAMNERSRKHRESIKACLYRHYRVTNFLPAGSFGHGTNVPLFSDIDYFMVLDEDDWPRNSALALREVGNVLANRFPFTPVRVSSPVVLVPFGRTTPERFEITPAYFDEESDDHEVFWIPDRQGGWMTSAPRAHNRYVNDVNQHLNGRVKPVIRLVKLWNGLATVGLRSIYLELKIAKRLRSVQGVTYRRQVRETFNDLLSNGLRAMRDPLGITGLIEPCSEARKDQALTRLETALIRADKALDAEESGKPHKAFEWWDKVFGGNFPAFR
ncbi:MAG: nucleotidyltransferase [Phenylobacterium sp.]